MRWRRLSLVCRELLGMNNMLLGKDSIVKGLQDQVGTFLERDLSKVKVGKGFLSPDHQRAS